LKEQGNVFFRDITEELNLRMVAPLLRNRVDISSRFWMVSPGDHQLRVGKLRGDFDEGVDNRLQPLVCAPFPEGENAMIRIAALRKVGIFGPSRQNSVSAHMHRAAAIFFPDQAAIGRKQDGNRIRKQQELSSYEPCRAVS